jgi:hypothetical protein
MFDISVSLDRFLRWYAPRKDFLRLHQQKNKMRMGTITAPTATGAAITAMLREEPPEDPICAVGRPVSAAAGPALDEELEVTVAVGEVGEEDDGSITDGETISPDEMLSATSVCDCEGVRAGDEGCAEAGLETGFEDDAGDEED